ncbi:predicted protein [Naegleria gruberi]|uniref:Predicted protein n=1 Tax=Naegleria gruberi TaxID=5762 RepID=D2VIV8_NAEGR|nr:uncharacterized protein NAEGRDRAFT_68817 [Naegleria gruberi]EFC43093.1 predicted protein [Naegleria gruberi]|eukprot:XP_002675837.1 predicted protein [Naegleria gruberi strain NEG-M]
MFEQQEQQQQLVVTNNNTPTSTGGDTSLATSATTTITFGQEIHEHYKFLTNQKEYGTKNHMNKFIERFSKEYHSSSKQTQLLFKVLHLISNDLLVKFNSSNQLVNSNDLLFVKNHLYTISMIARNIPFRGAFSDHVELLLDSMKHLCDLFNNLQFIEYLNQNNLNFIVKNNNTNNTNQMQDNENKMKMMKKKIIQFNYF